MKSILTTAVLAGTLFGASLLSASPCRACGDEPSETPTHEHYVPQPSPRQGSPAVLAGLGFGGGAVAAGLLLSVVWRKKR